MPHVDAAVPRPLPRAGARPRVPTVAALLLATALAACSGGGSGESKQDQPPVEDPHYPPMTVTATAGESEVTLEFAWGSVAVRYDVYWSTVSGLPLAQRTLVSGVTSPFRHEGLTNGTAYHYVVAWVDAQGRSYPQAEVSATPRVPFATPVLTAATAGDGAVLLRWEAARGYASFNVYWSRAPGVTPATGTKIARVLPHEPADAVPVPWEYAHEVPGGGPYHYVVTGVTAKGSESPPSGERAAFFPYGTTIARLDTDGTTRWAVGLDGVVAAESVSAFADGSFAVAGRFACTVVLGAGEPTETTLASTTCSGTPSDLFVARYAADGALLWARAAASSQVPRAVAVAALPDGSVAVTGAFRNQIRFGDATDSVNLVARSSWMPNVFVARYEPDGALAWARSAGADNGPWAAGGSEARSIAALSDGSVVVTGSFFLRLELDGGPVLQTAYGCNTNDFDVFLARYWPDGTVAWARRAGGCSWEEGLAVAAASDDSIRLTGRFSADAVFGPGEAQETTLQADAGYDAFLARYAADGALGWARSIRGAGNDLGVGVAVLPDGGAGLVGEFSDTATFGPGEPGQVTMPGGPALARYGADGAFQSVRWIDGEATARGVASAGGGALLVTGTVVSGAVFGAGTPAEQVLAPAQPEAFLARYAADGSLAWVRSLDRGPTYGAAVAALPAGGSVVVATREQTVVY